MQLKRFAIGQLDYRSLLRFFPFMQWLPGLSRDVFRPDMEAGIISAVLILPQSIALATLAGMPPEFGIYTSIFPVIIAAFWGSSFHALSGPNTAVCVLIAYSIAPFANVGDEYYVGFVLALTFMVGIIQLSLGIFKLGAVLDYISNTVISAIIFAVALVMIVSAFGDFFGILTNLDEPFFIKIYQTFNNISQWNIFPILVGTVTVAGGIIARRYYRRYALVIAVLIGTITALLLNVFFGSASTDIKMVGYLSLSLLPFSTPSFDLESMYVINQLIGSAFAIAFLGLMQTVLIARSLALKSGQRIDTNQEIIGQGVSNIVSPFLSSFASSGSFNRSAAHYDVGAKTPMAALYASVILAMAAFTASSAIAYIPMAAVSGVLILVGYGLIEPTTIKKALCTRQEAIIFFITFITALGFGLNAGVFIGLILSLIVYLWYASAPNVVVKTHNGPDNKPVTVVTIDGNLFFGSVRHIERHFAKINKNQGHSRILLRTDHITYIDVPGAEAILAELLARRKENVEMYLYITRSNIVSILRSTGCLEAFGEEYVIIRGLKHPMKDLLYPNATTAQDKTLQISRTS